MTLTAFFATLISVVMLIIGLAAFVLSRRQRCAYEKLARTETFHCLKCDSVYTAPMGSDSQPCPKCGYKNSKLKF